MIFDYVDGDAYDTSDVFYLPVRAMSGVDCYFAREDVDRQMQKLSESYDQVYYVTTRDTDYKAVTRLTEVFSLDDNLSYRFPLCPFPYKINVKTRNYTVYRHLDFFTFKPDDLYTLGGKMSDRQIILSNGHLQYGPYISLEPGKYRVDYTGENLGFGNVRVTRNNGTDALPTTMLKQQDAYSLSYEFNVDVSSNNVEFVLENNTDTPIKIERLKVRQIR